MCTISFKRAVSSMMTSKLIRQYFMYLNWWLELDLFTRFLIPSLNRVKNEFDSVPSYIYDDIDNWSMNDFVNVRNGIFVVKINTAIQKGEDHVFNCEVCWINIYFYFFCQNSFTIPQNIPWSFFFSNEIIFWFICIFE